MTLKCSINLLCNPSSNDQNEIREEYCILSFRNGLEWSHSRTDQAQTERSSAAWCTCCTSCRSSLSSPTFGTSGRCRPSLPQTEIRPSWGGWTEVELENLRFR